MCALSGNYTLVKPRVIRKMTCSKYTLTTPPLLHTYHHVCLRAIFRKQINRECAQIGPARTIDLLGSRITQKGNTMKGASMYLSNNSICSRALSTYCNGYSDDFRSIIRICPPSTTTDHAPHHSQELLKGSTIRKVSKFPKQPLPIVENPAINRVGVAKARWHSQHARDDAPGIPQGILQMQFCSLLAGPCADCKSHVVTALSLAFLHAKTCSGAFIDVYWNDTMRMSKRSRMEGSDPPIL